MLFLFIPSPFLPFFLTTLGSLSSHSLLLSLQATGARLIYDIEAWCYLALVYQTDPHSLCLEREATNTLYTSTPSSSPCSLVNI